MTLEQFVNQTRVSDEDLPKLSDSTNPTAQTLRKYFTKWKNIAKKKDLIASNRESEKLDEFIENLKCYKNEKQLSGVVATNPRSETNNQIIESAQSFKNRYKSQKKIIEIQRSKIDNQTKIINELKLGIIREDLLKSMENTKIEIRDIFNNCSGRLLIKAPLLQPPEDRDKIMILSQKAPNVLQKMQQRAIERAQYRNIILERKKLIEETRQKLLEEAIEKKKSLEEEERKRNLEAINEQRRKDLILQKRRLERKQEFESKCRLAKQFYEHLLVKQCFRKLYTNYNKAQEHQTLAKQFYERKQKARALNVWFQYVDSQYKDKYEVADAHFAFKTLKKAFQTIKEVRTFEKYCIFFFTIIYFSIKSKLLGHYKWQKIGTTLNSLLIRLFTGIVMFVSK